MQKAAILVQNVNVTENVQVSKFSEEFTSLDKAHIFHLWAQHAWLKLGVIFLHLWNNETYVIKVKIESLTEEWWLHTGSKNLF